MHHVLADINGLGTKWPQVYRETDKVKRQALLREILEPYQAIVDFPGCFVVDDLMEMFPDAKVILGLRSSPEQWRQSISTSLEACRRPSWYLPSILVPAVRYLAFHAPRIIDRACEDRYGEPLYFTGNTNIYVRHNEQMRKIVPKEKLLEFSPADGWGPLCAFLGDEVPKTDFPRLNDSAVSVTARLNRLRNESLKMFAAGFGTVLGVWLMWRKWDVFARHLRTIR